MVLCRFLLCAVLVLIGAIRCHTEVCDLTARRKRLQLRIAGKITVEKYFVEIHVRIIPQRSLLQHRARC